MLRDRVREGVASGVWTEIQSSRSSRKGNSRTVVRRPAAVKRADNCVRVGEPFPPRQEPRSDEGKSAMPTEPSTPRMEAVLPPHRAGLVSPGRDRTRPLFGPGFCESRPQETRMCSRTIRRRSTLALVAVLITIAAAPSAVAHPLGNFTVNHYARVEVSTREVTVRYVV